MRYTQKEPNKLKRRKGKLINNSNNNNSIVIYANNSKKLTEVQIKRLKEELFNITINNIKVAKFAKVNSYLNINKVFTKKGILVRMGRGKGKIIAKGLFLKPGQICFEIVPNIKVNIPSNNLLSNFLKKHSFFKAKIL